MRGRTIAAGKSGDQARSRTALAAWAPASTSETVRALCAVAQSIRRATRGTDICARYGGDECVVLLANCGQEAADTIAHRIRHNVYSATQAYDYAIQRLAVSIGVAVSSQEGYDLRALLRGAHRSMQQEKQGRRARREGIPGAGAVT